MMGLRYESGVCLQVGRQATCARSIVAGIRHPTRSLAQPRLVPRAAAEEAIKPDAAQEVEEDAAKSEEYSAEMSKKMGTNLTYRHEDGIDYNYLMEDVIVGSCLQTPADVDRLAEEGITTVFCLQVRAL